MKKLGIVVVFILVIVAGLIFTRDIWVGIVVEKGAEKVLGLDLRIGSFKTSLTKTHVNIADLTLRNPKDFQERIMIDMPLIYVDYDLPAILKGTIHLYDMKIEIKEFVVVKNKEGKLNLDSLKPVQDMALEAVAKKKGNGADMDLKIDSLELKIGKVTYKDYSGGGIPYTMDFDLKIDEKYTNITDPNALVKLIVVKALMNTTIASLTQFDVKRLSSTVGNTMATAQRVTGKATAAVSGTAGNLMKLPFGAKEKK
ncbi:MAG: AsmA family protein [Candidatus Omnitrophica bacterium]|nr:AsmA family protein [Candidatus Omnitrophota bacterium]